RVHAVGAADWNRRLFDELISLPDGTSYNAYLVRGSEKTALIDTVDPEKTQILVNNLDRLHTGRIDYIISNHAEQDHSGSIPALLKLHPGAKVIATPKGQEMLRNLLGISADRFIAAEDGMSVSLGDRTLEFFHTPWVHWPETMVTYNREDRILFSCDFFGSHLATTNLYASQNPKVVASAKRYYAEIMMPFRAMIRQNIAKTEGLDMAMIAPSHGPVFDDPALILDAYRDWISDRVSNEVVLPYVSMHGSTARMVEYLIDALVARGVMVRPFNLTVSDIGELAMALVSAATIVIGSPTVLAGPHPAAANASYLVNALRPKTRFLSVIGSYGWGGRMVEQLTGMVNNLKVAVLPPVMVKGAPAAETFRDLDRLAEDISNKHKIDAPSA
ncbi:MAG: FprA family A-type flavoprotein, partial [Candidatus Latescibacterota bacterium]